MLLVASASVVNLRMVVAYYSPGRHEMSLNFEGMWSIVWTDSKN